jgi:hypothetical protein
MQQLNMTIHLPSCDETCVTIYNVINIQPDGKDSDLHTKTQTYFTLNELCTRLGHVQ